MSKKTNLPEDVTSVEVKDATLCRDKGHNGTFVKDCGLSGMAEHLSAQQKKEEKPSDQPDPEQDSEIEQEQESAEDAQVRLSTKGSWSVGD